MPLAQKKPLTIEEKKMMIMLAAEMQSRGIPVPDVPKEALAIKSMKWPLDDRGYFISNDGKFYNPNVPQAVEFINSDSRFNMLVGGRGSSKTVSGSQKALKKIMRGWSGAILNPDFENFKYSTWPEFKRWIPWDMVVPSQRIRATDAWQPSQPFVMVFTNGARVYCKGLKDPDSARGPNINWLWYDEAGRDETGMAWKLAIASVRVGDNPQAWCTNTAKPPAHWTHKFFIEKDIAQDAIEAFGLVGKSLDDFVRYFHVTTEENKDNLDPGFYASLLATYHTGALRDRELGGLYVDDGGKIGDSSKIIKIKEILDEWKLGKSCRYWDMAATEKKLKNDPDEAVGTHVQATDERDPKYIIKDQVGGWWAWDKLKNVIVDVALRDGPNVTIVIEQEPGSGGKNQVAELQLYFKNHPTYPELKYYKIEAQRPTDRVQEAYTWFGYANAGNVFMIENPAWNKTFLDQVDGFTFMEHDDRVTSCSGAMRWLSPKFRRWSQTTFISL